MSLLRRYLAVLLAFAVFFGWLTAVSSGLVPPPPVPGLTGTLAANLSIQGMLLGGLYAVAASGLAIIFGVMRILNLAHGEFIVLGAYAGYWMFILFGLDPLLALLAAIAALGVVGFVVHVLVVRPVARLGFEPPIVSTFGLLLFLQTLMTIVWTGDPRFLLVPQYSFSWVVGPFALPAMRTITFFVSVFALLILYFFLSRTFLGKAIRATAVDPDAAELVGVPTERVRMVAFVLGSLFAGLAGALLSNILSFSPVTGPEFLLKSLVVMALGGVGSLGGVFVGGLILGVAETLGAGIFGSGFRNVIAFGMLLAILLAKPSGLFGIEEKK